MQKQLVSKDEMRVIGLWARTNNQNEMDPAKAKIGAIAGRYWGDQLAAMIPHQLHPGVTIAGYTDFENNEHGEYTYFIGAEVDRVDEIPEGFREFIIPAGTYCQLTTEPGPMPDVVINAWQAIWQMNENDFGGKRRYATEFEVYDERAQDPENSALDILISLES